jgi:hypothetical protein
VRRRQTSGRRSERVCPARPPGARARPP